MGCRSMDDKNAAVLKKNLQHTVSIREDIPALRQEFPAALEELFWPTRRPTPRNQRTDTVDL